MAQTAPIGPKAAKKILFWHSYPQLALFAKLVDRKMLG